MNGFDLVLYFIGGAVAIGLTVLGGTVSSTKPWHKPTFIALGIASFIVYAWIGVRAFEESKAVTAATYRAKQQAQQNMDDIKRQLKDSEIKRASDTRYLEGKLEVFSQFAPAIMELAKASEESTRKQYEAKVISDKQLADFTMEVVRKIREFSHKYSALEDQMTNEMINVSRQPNLTDAEKKQQWNQEMQKMTQKMRDLSSQRDFEFRRSILPDAIYARSELLRRKIPEPVLPGAEGSEIGGVLAGMLAGVYPELALADYLEIMAKQLSPK